MKLALALILLASLLIGGAMDYEEAQDQEYFYCDMVREGSWPNYKSINCGNRNNDRD